MYDPQMRGGVKLGADFGVVVKPKPDFLKPVHWSYFDISNGFVTNRPIIAKKRDFRRSGQFGAKK